MTAELVREAHDRLEEQVARGLVAEGYEVFVAPGAHLLPRELVGLRPDILARRGGENLLVEVKLVPTPGGAEQAKRMAQAVQSLPGWEVRLVTAPGPEPSSPWSLADAEARIGQAARLAGRVSPSKATTRPPWSCWSPPRRRWAGGSQASSRSGRSRGARRPCFASSSSTA